MGYPGQQGYVTPDANGTLVGHKPPAAERPGDYPARPTVGSPGSYGPPNNQDGQTPPGRHGPLAGYTPPEGRGPADGHVRPGAHGSPGGSQVDYGPAAWFGPQAGDGPPTGYRRPGATQAPGSFPDGASTRPLSVYQHQEPSAPAAGQAEDPPPAGDDDTSIRVVVRPSGTEPKLKCYLEVRCAVADDLHRTRERAGALREQLIATVRNW